MKLHIENLHITFTTPQPPAGLLATFAIAEAMRPAVKSDVPKIGDKWPGTEATYAGIAPSMSGDSLVHLLLWNSDTDASMEYEDAVQHAEKVNSETGSHLPTRLQSIVLFERLADRFDKNPWYWTLTKTPSGKAAFFQHFGYGDQNDDGLSAECRVRAVSEIPL